MKPVIKPADHSGGALSAFLVGVTPDDVRNKIGFAPNADEDPRFGASWSFTVDGVPCCVWWFRNGVIPRAWGNRAALEKVFGSAHVDWLGA